MAVSMRCFHYLVVVENMSCPTLSSFPNIDVSCMHSIPLFSFIIQYKKPNMHHWKKCDSFIGPHFAWFVQGLVQVSSIQFHYSSYQLQCFSSIQNTFWSAVRGRWASKSLFLSALRKQRAFRVYKHYLLLPLLPNIYFLVSFCKICLQ